jgi:sulfite reductase (NADPH) flavoprotein alpha-component
MIGPGTGIAPFRAFLEERRATGATGRNWLFFGDQRAATDLLYREELTAMQKDGTLARLDLAFSRDQAEKIYVQHRMLEHGAELWAWLQNGAHLYICGDASRMAKDVEAALHTIAEQHGTLTPEATHTYLTTLKSEKRYQRDVY